jgi:hypothetical protein
VLLTTSVLAEALRDAGQGRLIEALGKVLKKKRQVLPSRAAAAS